MTRKSVTNCILIASLITIILVTVYPFNFLYPISRSRSQILASFYYTTTIKDYVRNILLFIPWGIALARFTSTKTHNCGRVILISFFASAIISSNIELIQILLPTRTSSFSDIFCNTLGGILGSSLYCWRKDFAALIKAIVRNDYRQINLSFVLIVILIYSSIVSIAIAIFMANINFSNWAEDRYLAVGGEVTGQIHWTGYITSLHICDRALNKTEINTAFDRTHTFFSRLPSLVTSLILLDEQEFYPNLVRESPDFVWQSSSNSITTDSSPIINVRDSQIDRRIHQEKRVLFKPERNLISEYPVTELNQRIKKSQEFSLSIILASNLAKQPSPSRRIVSIANDIYAPNLLLAQSGKDLIFRLRTPTTSTIANQPFFIIPNVFNDLKLHQIIITFARHKLAFYIDSIEDKYTFDFKPSTHLKLYSPLFFKQWNVNLARYSLLKSKIIFYSLILSPLAILIITLLLNIKTRVLSKNNN